MENYIDFSNFPDGSNGTEKHSRFSNERKAQFDYVKVDTGTKRIRAFLGQKKQNYQLFFDDTPRITKIKGCPRNTANGISNKEILKVVNSNSRNINVSFNKISSKKQKVFF